MDGERFTQLLDTKAKLLSLEEKYPACTQVVRLHRRARRLLELFRNELGLTDEQFETLGGGTDKPPITTDD